MEKADFENERGHSIYGIFNDQEKVPCFGNNLNSKTICGSLKDAGLDLKVMRDVENYLGYSGGMDELKQSGYNSSNPKLTGITTSVIRMDKVKEEKPSQIGQSLKKLSHKVFKNEGFFDIASEIKLRKLSYSHFIPLHQLWKQYIKGLTESNSVNSGPNGVVGARGGRGIRFSQLSQSLSQADLHGSMISVISSKNKSCVNVQGIVVKETKETFVIISADDKVRTILKSQSIFGIVISNDYLVTIYGSQLCYHPCERIKHKFRHRDSLNIAS
ncbi:POP4 like ribonuclease P subunit [Cryptosporidium sp. chipmunk genotype I]|uniref:POP4 like ribonuclease P subunit n=1 Tax=Cryptosporidium sp. chipmunk genotype I TaxID=1280935 RepID=UPI00351A5140|nr:POP4 like ribonuclease P subunit [Cryptosporidium sp. chipmunk genotype I]